jgi:hypothetical protein
MHCEKKQTIYIIVQQGIEKGRRNCTWGVKTKTNAKEKEKKT